MKRYTVHLHREMKLVFTDIDAETAQAAAAIATELPATRAACIEDSEDGENLSAIVDEHHGRQTDVVFDAGRWLMAAPDLFEAVRVAGTALSKLPDFHVPELKTTSYQIGEFCAQAIASALPPHVVDELKEQHRKSA